MTKAETTNQSILNITIMALVSLVAIVGILSLVINRIPTTTIDESYSKNIAGDSRYNPEGPAPGYIGPPVEDNYCRYCMNKCSIPKTGVINNYCNTCLTKCGDAEHVNIEHDMMR